MVHNEILIKLNMYYKLDSTRDGVSYYIACGEGSDKPARTHSIEFSFLAAAKYES